MTPVHIPEDCDPEDFVEGYKTAMRHVADSAEQLAGEPPEEPDDGDKEGRCDECGSPLIQSLGGDECIRCGA